MNSAEASGLCRTTFLAADVTVHLQPAQVRLVSVAEKERLIRGGETYGKLLTPEEPPGELQRRAYENALERSARRLAGDVLILAGAIARLRGEKITLVSLARGGTPVGALLQRALRARGLDSEHHTLSIIRGVGLDLCALDAVTARRGEASVMFVDGWTGKGSVGAQLRASLGARPLVPRELAVISDPAGRADLAATHDDYLLPHACLNATVSGLLSRTFLTGEGLHGALFYEKLAPYDVTNAYLDHLTPLLSGKGEDRPAPAAPVAPVKRALEVARELGCADPHKVKPSVGEATRVFLRRAPGALVLREASSPDTEHLRRLAGRAGVPVHVRPQLAYAAMALVQ